LMENANDYLVQRFPQQTEWSPLTRMLLTDMSTVLPGDLLVKMDRMSMANSLEARSPFLDHKVVEAASSLPDKLRMTLLSKNKVILRQLYGHLLPRPILTRPKSGFGVPIDEWFRGALGDMARDVLLGQQAKQRGIFDEKNLQKLIDNHQTKVQDNGHVL